MQLRYRVHGVNEVPRTRKVVFEGKEVQAQMLALEVELTWDDKDGRDHGSTTLRFMGADEVNWARSVFVVDGYVDASFTKAADEPSDKTAASPPTGSDAELGAQLEHTGAALEQTGAELKDTGAHLQHA